MSTPSPVVRHPSLAPFSREHQFALLHAHEMLKAASGTKAQRKQTLLAFIHAWVSRISNHFAQEERLLRPLMAPVDGIMFVYMQDQLRTLAAEAGPRSRQTDPGDEWVRNFGLKLENHLKWEENHLMALLERKCSAAQLSALGAQSSSM
jgi:hemerythrin-like domain-containing protein